MALIQIETPQIEIDIPNKTIGGTVLKRKAKLFTMIYNQSVKQLVLSWIVMYYAQAANDTYGDLISEKGISSYTKESIADNGTMVSPTGEILIPDAEGNYDEAQPRLGQYDFFYSAAQTTPIQVHTMIRNYGLMANWN
ncbi:MAG: hypothetical protein H7258_05385 [Ferruginibacter sp.]|nr:hypothetical protein [Ferruginibacter sp.]